jgi:hypothetical protein
MSRVSKVLKFSRKWLARFRFGKIDFRGELLHGEVLNESRTMFEQIYRVIRTETLPALDNRRRDGTKSEAEVRSELVPLIEAGRLQEANHQLILGAALLWHDHLESAHQIAQEIESADGSLLHGMMHRREPDYSNAAYWFRKVGHHPAFRTMALESKPILQGSDAALCGELIGKGAWDPFAFIRACESVARGSSSAHSRTLLQEVQRIEFECFLRHLCGE